MNPVSAFSNLLMIATLTTVAPAAFSQTLEHKGLPIGTTFTIPHDVKIADAWAPIASDYELQIDPSEIIGRTIKNNQILQRTCSFRAPGLDSRKEELVLKKGDSFIVERIERAGKSLQTSVLPVDTVTLKQKYGGQEKAVRPEILFSCSRSTLVKEYNLTKEEIFVVLGARP